VARSQKFPSSSRLTLAGVEVRLFLKPVFSRSGGPSSLLSVFPPVPPQFTTPPPGDLLHHHSLGRFRFMSREGSFCPTARAAFLRHVARFFGGPPCVHACWVRRTVVLVADFSPPKPECLFSVVILDSDHSPPIFVLPEFDPWLPPFFCITSRIQVRTFFLSRNGPRSPLALGPPRASFRKAFLSDSATLPFS